MFKVGRYLGVGALPLALAASCGDSGSDGPGDAQAGSPSAGQGASAGDSALAGSTTQGGTESAAGAGGRPDVMTETGGVGGEPEAAAGFAGAAGALGGAGGDFTAGGAAGQSGEGGAGGDGPACLSVTFAVMPASPLAPADAACAASCAVPPMNGLPPGGACASLGSTPPASATDMTGGPPASLVGLPCDNGWCNGNTKQVFAIGDLLGGTSDRENNTVAIASADVVHVARTYTKNYEFKYTVANAAGVTNAWGPLDEDKWWIVEAFPFGPTPQGRPALGQIAADPRPGGNRAYISYGGVTSGGGFGQPLVVIVGPRFGTLTGSGWVFEDLPAGWDGRDKIQVDSDGSALVLHEQRLYRHRAEGGFDEVALPCGVTVGDMATDASGALYVSSAGYLHRRASDGSWSREAHSGGSLIAAGGTIHTVGVGGISHRAGTAWSVPIEPPLPQSGLPYQDVAVDACWAPHLVASSLYDTLNYRFEIDYARWTARGFLTARLHGGSEFPVPKVAAGVNRAYLAFGGSLYSMPLR